MLKKFMARRDSSLGSRYERLPTIDVRDYRAVAGGQVDCTDAINNAFTDGARLGLEVRIPEGTFKISAPLVWNDPYPRISGVPGLTIIQPDAQDYDWLEVGNNSGATNGPQGYVRDLQLQNTSLPQAPLGTTAGFRLNGTRFVTVENVWVRRAPVGFDAINNNFGSSFRNCRTLFGENRIGFRLRGQDGGVFGSGNDIPFYNCWLHGRDAGVWMEPFGGGYHLYGGQVSAGSGASGFDDLRGNVIMNATMDGDGSLGASTPAEGGVSASFFGVSFESTNQGWAIRPHAGSFKLECHSCFFKGNAGSAGILKIAGTIGFAQGGADVVTLVNSSVAGDFTEDPPIVLNTNTNLRPVYHEVNSANGGNLSFASTPVNFLAGQGLLMRATSGLDRANAVQSQYWMSRGIRFEKVSGTLRLSFDQGATWSTVDTTPVV